MPCPYPARQLKMLPGGIFQGGLLSHQGLAFPSSPAYSSWSHFTPRPPLMLLHLCMCSRGNTENVTIINVPLQDPVLLVLSFLANDSSLLFFPVWQSMCISAFTPNGNVFVKDSKHALLSAMPGRAHAVLILLT